MLLPNLIKRGQYSGCDDGPEADLRKQRERGEQEEAVDQQLDGMCVRQLRFAARQNTIKKNRVGDLC